MIYYIRAIESDWPLVESLAIALRVAKRAQSGQLVGQGWVYIGPVLKPTGETVTIPAEPELSLSADGVASLVNTQSVDLTAPVRDDSGNVYIHANLVYDGSLRALAEAKAVENPALADALAEIPRFFVTDTEGNPRAPSNPARVIF